MTEPLISNLSDTAHWVAVYRAWESARPDALFKDSLAERLAGERGRAIAAVAPQQTRNGWPMVVRTKLIDDLIATSLAEGCDRVLNLAAGLDTRPYRLDLPPSLDWIEADLPAMIEEKERLLAHERPRCDLRREHVDLRDGTAREAFLSRATDGASSVLVITEGLLTYLDDEQVTALGRALARPPIRWWLFDITSPAVVKMLKRSMGRHLHHAPMPFAPPNGIAFFEAMGGWKVLDVHSLFRAALRLKRLPRLLRFLSFFPEPDPRSPGTKMWSAVVRLERA
jgi:methyltransferase (TIGR00027 family)